MLIHSVSQTELLVSLLKDSVKAFLISTLIEQVTHCKTFDITCCVVQCDRATQLLLVHGHQFGHQRV